MLDTLSPVTQDPTKRTVPFRDAVKAVLVLLDALAPACERSDMAGSLRRQKPEVGDIEIVANPVWERDMFGEPVPGESGALEAALAGLVREGVLAWDTLVRRNGPKYKRFTLPALGGLPFDLFLADADNYGNTMAIRTGDAFFSRGLVTQRRYGGLMPDDMSHSDGSLWVWDTRTDGRRRQPCRTEAEFFAALGLPVLDPSERDAAAVERLRRSAPDDRRGVEAG